MHMAEELVKMSEKGQLVVPQKIRKKEGFHNSDRFVAIEVKEGVLFKKVNIPEVKIEFEALSKELGAHLKKRNVKQIDIGKAVKWAKEK